MEIEKIDTLSLTTSPQINLPDLFSRWLSNHLSKGTRSTYGGSLKEFAHFLMEKNYHFEHPSEIKPDHIIQYRDYLFDKENSNKTINRKLSALSSLFKEMRFEQLVSINPAESVKRPPDDIKKIRTSFKDHEIKTLLDLYSEETRQGLQNKTLLSLFAYTAQRVSTLRILRSKDIQLVDGIIVLHLKVKGGKLRQIPLGHEPARLVKKILSFKTSQEDYLFTPQRGSKTHENKPISSVAVFYLIKNSLKKAGLDETRSAHSFRRSVLTKLLNAHGISAEKVRDEVSFHASLNTLGIYKIPQETKMTENPILGILYTK